jgi:hypothetical protein
MRSALTARILVIIEEFAGAGHFRSLEDMRVDGDRFLMSLCDRAGPLRAARSQAWSLHCFWAVVLRLLAVAEKARREGAIRPSSIGTAPAAGLLGLIHRGARLGQINRKNIGKPNNKPNKKNSFIE